MSAISMRVGLVKAEAKRTNERKNAQFINLNIEL